MVRQGQFPGRASRIWEYTDVKIEQDGVFVKLIAPCGQFRRVRPETARKIGMDLLRMATRVTNKEAAKVQDRKLYVITRIETGEDGASFALCGHHFDQWDAKDKVVWRVIGENTSEPCNYCNSAKEKD